MDQEILNLKVEGKSFQGIGKGLGMNNGFIDQEILRLKGEGKSLREIGKVLGISHVAVTKRLRKLSAGNDEVLTSKNPPIDMDLGPNSLDSPPRKGQPALKKASQGMILGSGDLFLMISEFLEERGIPLYRMKAGPEAYQVEHGPQVIRFYVQRIFKRDVTDGEKK